MEIQATHGSLERSRVPAPGKTKKDVRGVDYFVGAEELMRYLDKIDLGFYRGDRKAARGGRRRGSVQSARAERCIGVSEKKQSSTR
ncbi:uncharacterized protein IUM83_10367 [Phytophthora cinnamomi]|uniref:uncharacterized protein n=1 Tax=Phytophthora cinnamomi TaxID=4785 RepID=UPI00355AA235|nr:hypothetical protein IUM83_10367 [Phytophthora cinnamomi]